jgi:hypothetical protein
MKKKLFIATLICSFLLQIKAQKPVVKMSPNLDVDRSLVFKDHLYSDNTGHYVYFHKENPGLFGIGGDVKVVLQKYDTKFKQVYSKVFESDKKGVNTLGMAFLKNKFVWFTSERNSKEDYIRYDIVPITKEGKAEKLVKIAQFKYEGRRDIPITQWEFAEDSSRFSFIAYEDRDLDEEDMEVYTAVLDEKLLKIWDKKFKFKHTQETMEIISKTVNKKGDVFLLAKVYEGDKAKESKKDKKKNKKVAAYDLRLYQLTASASEPKEYKLDIGGSFLKYGKIAIAPSGDLIATGFYSSTRGGATQGVFYMTLSADDGTVKNANKKEFSSADLAILGDKNTEKDKGDEGLGERFEFREINFKADGTTFISAEENYTVTYTYYNGRTTTTRTYYCSNDIVVITIDKNGKVERLSLIPKRQKFDTKMYENFATLANKNGVAFFYNDDVDNLKKPIGSKPKYISSAKDCIAVVTFIDNNGKMTRKELFGRDDAKALFIPKSSNKINDKEIFFIARKFSLFGNDDFRMGTMSIE